MSVTVHIPSRAKMHLATSFKQSTVGQPAAIGRTLYMPGSVCAARCSGLVAPSP
jgi:hypothetical protein